MRKQGEKLWIIVLVMCCIASMMPQTVYAQSITTLGSASVNSKAKIKLNKTKATLKEGKSVQLKVGGTKSNVTWSSDKKTVATVTKKGKVTAKKAGTAKITAKVDGKTLTCTVTVKSGVSALKLSKTQTVLGKGETETLTVTITSTIKGKKAQWKSSDTSVATVKNGTITAKGGGFATITATCDGKKATCKVGVVESIDIVCEEEGDCILWLSDAEDNYMDEEELDEEEYEETEELVGTACIGVVINDGDDQETWETMWKKNLFTLTMQSKDKKIAMVEKADEEQESSLETNMLYLVSAVDIGETEVTAVLSTQIKTIENTCNISVQRVETADDSEDEEDYDEEDFEEDFEEDNNESSDEE